MIDRIFEEFKSDFAVIDLSGDIILKLTYNRGKDLYIQVIMQTDYVMAGMHTNGMHTNHHACCNPNRLKSKIKHK